MFLKFLYAPLLYPQMLWIIIPVLLSIILTEIYFKKYHREGLGHHSSLENTIFMIFICFNLAWVVSKSSSPLKIYTLILFIIFTITVSFLDFFHKLPTKLWLKLSSKYIIGYISYIFIVLIYSDILANFSLLEFMSMLISAGILYIVLIAAAKIFAYLEPRTYPEIENYLKAIEQDIGKSKKIKKK